MGVLVSSSGSRLYCERQGCRRESELVQGDNDGQGVVHERMQRRGWQCLHDGTDYCPDHAYGKSLPPADKDQAAK